MVLKVYVDVVVMIGSAGSAGRRLGVGCATREVKVVQWDLVIFGPLHMAQNAFKLNRVCLVQPLA